MTSDPRRNKLGGVLLFLLLAVGIGIALVASGVLGGEGERPEGAELEAHPGPVAGEADRDGADEASVGPGPAGGEEWASDPVADAEPVPADEDAGDRVAAGDARPAEESGGHADAGESAGASPSGSTGTDEEGARPRPNAATPTRDDTGARAERDEATQVPAEAGATSPEVDRILARAEETYASLASLRATFEQEVHVPLLDRHRRGTGIWYQKGRSRFKMDFEDPPEDVIVADGVHLWLYYPSTNPKQVIRQSLDAPAAGRGTADVLARILEEARTAYRAEYGAREEVAGRTTDRIDLTPVVRSPYRQVRVWVATDDHLVRRFEIVEENETVRTVTLRDLEPNASISDATFRFQPPADADVFAG